jgi:iron complex outermembrane receptor protein
MRITVVAALCLCIVGISTGADAEAAIRKQTNIPAQGLGPALQVLAKDRNLQVIYRSEVIGKLQTSGAVGELTTGEAVTELLKGTGLAFRYLGDNAITIVPVGSTPDAVSPTSSAAYPSSAPSTGDQQPQEGKKSVLDNFRLAQANQGTNQRSSTVGSDAQSTSASSENSARLEEILVTAQKQGEQRLQDVPVPITVLNANQLADTGQVLLRDYYSSVPSLNLLPNEIGNTFVSIRGLTLGQDQNPTVGILIDDVPFGSSLSAGGGFEVPDIDPGDLARIEVLRGPQGTLYGADSLGGLIRYVMKDPSTDRFSGRIEAGTSDVYNGTEPGFNVRGSANIPVGDTLAVRVSAFRRQDPGYIDNPVLHKTGVNEVQADGGHLSVLWRPSGDFSVKLSALYQSVKAAGSSEVVPSLGGLQQNFVAGTGRADRTSQAYSATIDYKFGGVQLTSVTGYNTSKYDDSVDLTYDFGSLASSFRNFTGAGSPFYDHDRNYNFTQEIRLSGSFWKNVDWMIGGFYLHQHSPVDVIIGADNPATGGSLGDVANLNEPVSLQEYAGFGDLTYHVSDRFDIQVGGRESHYKNESDTNIDSGPLYGISPAISPAVQISGNAFTFMVTPQFRISRDLMVYARIASGYRPGGPNSEADILQGTPAKYAPDKTQNYELGIKGDVLERALSIDASIYHINWKDIQLLLSTPTNFSYASNGGAAKSEGVELSVTSRPLSGLTINAWATYDDAVLTQSLPSAAGVYGASGERLPMSSRFSGNISLEQTFPLWNGATGFAGGMWSYIGDRLGLLTGNPDQPAPRQEYPAYRKIDLRTGVTYQSWTVSVYVNNANDSRGLIGGGLGSLVPSGFFEIRPRTVGVNFVTTF